MAPLIDLRNVAKRYWLRKNRSGDLKSRALALFHKDKREIHEELWALRGVSFTVGRGESVGIIGRNGSGKSTLLKLIAGIHRPTSGDVLVARGIQIGTLIELGIGFHLELSGRENVRLNAAIHGLSAAEIDQIYPGVVEYSGLRDFMDVQLKNYSSGMHMRLAFAVAANLRPDVMLLDEIFAVGDEEFQKQCRRTMEQFLSEGKTILFVSHSSYTVREVCQRVCMLEHGQLLYDGPVEEGLAAYRQLQLTSSTSSGFEMPATAADQEEEAALRRLDFLRTHGLASHHYVLELRCGQPTNTLRTFVEPGRLFVCTPHTAIDLHGLPPINVATADAAFTGVPPELMGPNIVSIVRALAPDGRFYAGYDGRRIRFEQLEVMSRSAGGRVDRIDGSIADGQQMAVFTRV